MPCGQKKSSKAMIQSQTVTPPLAAIDGTTFRLKTATTKSRTRSQRPRTRFRCGWLASWVSADKRAVLGPYRYLLSFRAKLEINIVPAPGQQIPRSARNDKSLRSCYD